MILDIKTRAASLRREGTDLVAMDPHSPRVAKAADLTIVPLSPSAGQGRVYKEFLVKYKRIHAI
jgi:hypothetical protein